MNFRNRQTGMSPAGWLFMILVFGGALSLGLKLVPVYMENNTVSKVIEALSREPGLAQRSNADLLALIKQRLKVNSIREFDMKKNFTFNRENGQTRLILDYEVRMSLIHNLDIVAAFHDEVLLR